MSRRIQDPVARWALRIALIFALLGLALVVADPLLTWLSLQGSISRGISPGRRNILSIRHALYIYNYEYGELPYDRRGPEFALYKLKPFVEDVNLFRCPIGDKINPGPPAWDDANHRLLNSDYDYINQPGINMQDHSREIYLVILAERTGVRKSGKVYLNKIGVTGWFKYDKEAPKEIVGKVGKYHNGSGGFQERQRTD